MAHKAQLRLCHQLIETPRRMQVFRRRQFCSLKTGLRWCVDCDYYVCDVHAEARHVAHKLIED